MSDDTFYIHSKALDNDHRATVINPEVYGTLIGSFSDSYGRTGLRKRYFISLYQDDIRHNRNKNRPGLSVDMFSKTLELEAVDVGSTLGYRNIETGEIMGMFEVSNYVRDFKDGVELEQMEPIQLYHHSLFCA